MVVVGATVAVTLLMVMNENGFVVIVVLSGTTAALLDTASLDRKESTLARTQSTRIEDRQDNTTVSKPDSAELKMSAARNIRCRDEATSAQAASGDEGVCVAELRRQCSADALHGGMVTVAHVGDAEVSGLAGQAGDILASLYAGAETPGRLGDSELSGRAGDGTIHQQICGDMDVEATMTGSGMAEELEVGGVGPDTSESTMEDALSSGCSRSSASSWIGVWV